MYVVTAHQTDVHLLLDEYGWVELGAESLLGPQTLPSHHLLVLKKNSYRYNFITNFFKSFRIKEPSVSNLRGRSRYFSTRC